MRVITLKPHGNVHGPVWRRVEGGGLEPRGGDAYGKKPGDIYDHPSPQQLIDDKVLKLPAPLDRDGDGHAGGSPPGEQASAAIGTRRRKARPPE